MVLGLGKCFGMCCICIVVFNFIQNDVYRAIALLLIGLSMDLADSWGRWFGKGQGQKIIDRESANEDTDDSESESDGSIKTASSKDELVKLSASELDEEAPQDENDAPPAENDPPADQE